MTSPSTVEETVGTERQKPYVVMGPRLRVLAACLIPIGPAAVAVLRFVMPYHTTDDAAEVVRHVAAHQSTESAVVWLGFIASMTLVPGVLLVGRVARRAAPRLTVAALLLLVPGYLSLAYLVAGDAAVLFAVRHGLPLSDAAASYSSLHSVLGVAEGAFVLGHVVGTVLLGIALLRTTTVPRWAAVATIVSQPLHFVAAVIVSSHGLDLFAWGLNAVGFAAVSFVILRTRD